MGLFEYSCHRHCVKTIYQQVPQLTNILRFQTYFPHVDNIYSHRSTQKYKRKPFVSHYWDCRLKGRPPGTAKSDDPNKKKRKRQARERDLCDVKIKITEFFPGARAAMGESDSGVIQPGANNLFGPAQPGASMLNDGTFRSGPPGSDGSRYYTIQRVNGSNGQADGVGGGHKHTLDESDRVKRNSIQRHMLKEEKVKRRFQVSNFSSLVLRRNFRNGPWPLGLEWSKHSTCCRVNVDFWRTSIPVMRP
jgi:hypothetical protein